MKLLPDVDIGASLARVGEQYRGDMLKLPEDLDRYSHVIAADRPEMIVECGTWRGGSARWFAAIGVDVVTVDVESQPEAGYGERITWIIGGSTDPDVVARVTVLAGPRRCMVVLDSDHSAEHVAAEIEAYGPLVSPGCHLVVEDGIIRWMPKNAGYAGSPMDAIEDRLASDPNFERDEVTEAMHPVSMSPCGWWKRR